MDETNIQELTLHYLETKCLKTRDKLFKLVYPTIIYLANKFGGNSIDDLIQEGSIAFIDSLGSYNPERCLFYGWVRRCIWYGFINFTRLNCTIPRGTKTMHRDNLSVYDRPKSHSEIVKLAKDRKLPYEKVCHFALLGQQQLIENMVEGSDNPLSNVEKLEDLEKLNQVLSSLENTTYNIIYSNFIDETSQADIARDYNITHQAVKYRIKAGIDKIKKVG